MAGLLERVPFDRMIVAIDPGKALNRVWVTTADGLVGEPMSLPTSRAGIDRLGGCWLSGVRRAGVRDRGDGRVASGVGGGARAALAGVVARVRAVGDTGGPEPARDAAVQDRRPRLRGAGLARAAGRRAPGEPRGVEAMLGGGRASPPADSRAQAAAAAAARPAQRAHARACRPRRATAGRSRLRRRPAARSWPARRRSRAAPPSPRSLQARAGGRLSDATAAFWAERWQRVPGAARGRRAARRPARPRPRSLRGAARGHRVRRRSTRAAARRQRRPDPDQPARRLDRPRRGVRRAHAPDRALRDARAPLLGHRPRARQLRVRDRPPTRRDQPHRPARTPRRADGHRLGPGPVRARLPAPPRRTQRPRHDRHPSPRRAGPPRLPALLATPSHPTALRRSALRSRQARPRAVTALSAMPRRRRNLACRPPALAGPNGAHESLPHDGA